ncbi:MAG: TrmH family RNA methyltransferase [Flavobacteriaceae bacterium]|nr:TrmH family RNA methyltransferase [Flavobacteriaceae bacterium]
MKQHTHESSEFIKRRQPLIIIADSLEGPANIGALFRIADAFGVEKIVFGNSKIDTRSARLRRTARDTHKKVKYEQCDELLSSINAYKKQGYRILALEITTESIPIHQFQTTYDQPYILVIGNESLGISHLILENCDEHLHISMFGNNSSMNVIQATSIALYALTKH